MFGEGVGRGCSVQFKKVVLIVCGIIVTELDWSRGRHKRLLCAIAAEEEKPVGLQTLANQVINATRFKKIVVYPPYVLWDADELPNVVKRKKTSETIRSLFDATSVDDCCKRFYQANKEPRGCVHSSVVRHSSVAPFRLRVGEALS